ncbi:hypothetical protein MANI_013370 [Metarhizium anisopliae]|nr:hypothetical protein MANI_013370 [Metarhizium anisopliae]
MHAAISARPATASHRLRPPSTCALFTAAQRSPVCSPDVWFQSRVLPDAPIHLSAIQSSLQPSISSQSATLHHICFQSKSDETRTRPKTTTTTTRERERERKGLLKKDLTSHPFTYCPRPALSDQLTSVIAYPVARPWTTTYQELLLLFRAPGLLLPPATLLAAGQLAFRLQKLVERLISSIPIRLRSRHRRLRHSHVSRITNQGSRSRRRHILRSDESLCSVQQHRSTAASHRCMSPNVAVFAPSASLQLDPSAPAQH